MEEGTQYLPLFPMASQNNYSYSYSFEQGSRPRSFQAHQPTGFYSDPGYGGIAMDRVPNYSDESYGSSSSGLSGTIDDSSPQTPLSPATMSSQIYSYDQSYGPHYGAAYETKYDPSYSNEPVDVKPIQELPIRPRTLESNHQRHTPSSLEWPLNTELWKNYAFVVKKGREPHMELLSTKTPSYQTPQRVYLDQAR